MIKVLHLTTFQLSGGAGIAASRLNSALNDNGVQSKLLVGKSSVRASNVSGLDTGFSGKSLFWGRFILERLFFFPYERNSEVRYAYSPAIAGANLLNNPLVQEADIIHLHWINFGFLSVHSLGNLLKLGKPVVWTMHDMWPFTGGCHHSGDCDNYTRSCGNCKFLKAPKESDLSYRRLHLKKKIWPPAASWVAVACSQWLGSIAQNSSLMKQLKVINIPNPINTNLFQPKDTNTSRTSLNLAADKDYLVFAAAKVSATGKGFLYLKEALKILVTKNPLIRETLELLVIGGGDNKEIEDIPLNAHFLGYIKNEETMTRVYSAASLYVTPSLEENLPNTIMEALACGTPCVGFRIGGIPEMIDHLENGYIAEYKSAESLAEGIRWVLKQNTDGRLSAAARQKVLREYDEKLVAKKYIELYQSILE